MCAEGLIFEDKPQKQDARLNYSPVEEEREGWNLALTTLFEQPCKQWHEKQVAHPSVVVFCSEKLRFSRA